MSSVLSFRKAVLAASLVPLLSVLPGLPSLAAGAADGARVSSGQAGRGRQVFAQCMACHRLDRGGSMSIGPNLYGVVGRAAGAQPGFAYSPAMRRGAQPWTDARLDAFLAAPARVVPGNRMPFAGLSNPADRRAVIAYLRSAAK